MTVDNHGSGHPGKRFPTVLLLLLVSSSALLLLLLLQLCFARPQHSVLADQPRRPFALGGNIGPRRQGYRRIKQMRERESLVESERENANGSRGFSNV